jgi:hypothetical protein
LNGTVGQNRPETLLYTEGQIAESIFDELKVAQKVKSLPTYHIWRQSARYRYHKSRASVNMLNQTGCGDPTHVMYLTVLWLQ